MDTLFVKPTTNLPSGQAKIKRLFQPWGPKTPRSNQAKRADYFGASDVLTELDFEHDTVSSPHEFPMLHETLATPLNDNFLHTPQPSIHQEAQYPEYGNYGEEHYPTHFYPEQYIRQEEYSYGSPYAGQRRLRPQNQDSNRYQDHGLNYNRNYTRDTRDMGPMMTRPAYQQKVSPVYKSSGPKLAGTAFRTKHRVSDSDLRSLASSVSTDASNLESRSLEDEAWEPEESMADSAVPLIRRSEKWPTQLKKLLVRGSKYEIMDSEEQEPRIEEINDVPESFESTARPGVAKPAVYNPGNQTASYQNLRLPPMSRFADWTRPKQNGAQKLESKQIEPASFDSTASVEGIIRFCRMITDHIILLKPFEHLLDMKPHLALVVVALEIVIVLYLLYQLSIVIETLALAVRSICLPMIIAGKVLGYF